MYSKKNTLNRAVYWMGPIGILIFCLLLLTIILIFVLRNKKKENMKDNKFRFKELLIEYTEKSFQNNYSDDLVDNYIKLFIFDDTIFPQSILDSGNSVNNASWNNDSEIFGSLCKILHNMLGVSTKRTSKHYHSKQIWDRLDFAIKTFSKKQPPWGDNWYQFAITYPLFLVSMAYFKEDYTPDEDLFLIRYLSSYIKKYFISFEKGFKDTYTYPRDGPNAVMMAVPYIGGNILMGTYDYNDPGIKYVRNYVNLARVTKGDGLYDCDTFVFHTFLGPAFGYITSAMPDFKFISEFFDNKETMKSINRILEKTEHPTINLHFGPWFNRTSNMRGLAKHGAYGFFTFDYMRGVSAKTEDWILSYRGQQQALCYYESDRANFKWGQYWFSARRFLYKDTETALQQELIPYYSGCLSYNNITLEMRSNTSSTETHMPLSSSCIICALPKCIGVFNTYKIKYSQYTFDVKEINLITESGAHFYYNFNVDENTHANNPFTVAVNFGDLEEEGSTTTGEMYKFKEAASFVYKGDGGEIVKMKIKHPKKFDVTYDAVQIRPHISAITRVLECGFSTMHNDRTSNECIKTPDIHTIETTQYILHHPPTQPHLLYLYDIKNKQCAVSNDMGVEFKSTITVPMADLQKMFKASDYIIPGVMTVNGDHTKNIPSGKKYQLLIKNVKLSV